MIAYFCVAGKQFVAGVGDILVECPHIKGNVGDIIVSKEVLGINDQIGQQKDSIYLDNAEVKLEITKQGKKKKLRIVKFISQKRHKRWKGHRTLYTNLQVKEINWRQ